MNNFDEKDAEMQFGNSIKTLKKEIKLIRYYILLVILMQLIRLVD